MAKVSMAKTLVTAALVTACGSALAYSGPPAGWNLVPTASQSNVKVYRKGTSEVYAQVVDMVGGAKVEMLLIRTGTSGGFNYYKRDSIDNWYFYGGSSSRVSVINGDYFNPNIYPTTLSFAVRSAGTLVEPGGDPKNDLQIEFFNGQGALVVSASAWRMANTSAENAIGGYSPPLSPRYNEAVGRTGLCTLSPVSGPSRFFLVLSHKKATQPIANQDFNAWRCNAGSVVMMDGSSSAQMRANGISVYGDDGGGGTRRAVPQAIAIRNQ